MFRDPASSNVRVAEKYSINKYLEQRMKSPDKLKVNITPTKAPISIYKNDRNSENESPILRLSSGKQDIWRDRYVTPDVSFTSLRQDLPG